MSLPGVFETKKKDGTIYYRSSITYKGKHISLGSFDTQQHAHSVYLAAHQLIESKKPFEELIYQSSVIPFAKRVSLLNFRDHGIYIKNPIYLKKTFFNYYLDETTVLIFDIDDLFYYSNHKIQKRGGYLFVADYGMQINILSRYGIKNYSVLNKDYRHANQNEYDYTYDNMEIINPYYGVSSVLKNGTRVYKSKIHINGNTLIGYYDNEIDAAIAYNKAIDIVTQNGCTKQFQTNYILSLSPSQYALRYQEIKISSKIKKLITKNEGTHS